MVHAPTTSLPMPEGDDHEPPRRRRIPDPRTARAMAALAYLPVLLATTVQIALLALVFAQFQTLHRLQNNQLQQRLEDTTKAVKSANETLSKALKDFASQQATLERTLAELTGQMKLAKDAEQKAITAREEALKKTPELILQLHNSVKRLFEVSPFYP